MKPQIYGYLRVIDDLADATIAQQERGLRKLADAEGFRLAGTYYEDQPGYYGTFYQLTAELKQGPVHHLVVPSLEHLSTHPLLRAQMLRCLDEAGVQVWTVEP